MGRTLHHDDMDEIARRVAALLRSEPKGDRWLTTRQAAEHLGLSVAALHKLTSERRIPFAQPARGGKLWFKASDLDSWRYSGG